VKRILSILFCVMTIISFTTVSYARWGWGKSLGQKAAKAWNKTKSAAKNTARKAKDSYNRNAPKVKKEAKDFSTGFKETQ
jgi:gas vesicle protein